MASNIEPQRIRQRDCKIQQSGAARIIAQRMNTMLMEDSRPTPVWAVGHRSSGAAVGAVPVDSMHSADIGGLDSRGLVD
ncbi:hypothetical protein BDN70DRAFT_107510 [Pholiota conissans]|uniref:Uncharacterized protein n=1 Tax=Pholiota conissans TaxID=109636 RepID=A0A9P5ZCH3_9AGAR|nr:hypothetical protein BDN70DRAFT_107510 [Pholiota conissans]